LEVRSRPATHHCGHHCFVRINFYPNTARRDRDHGTFSRV
jgi:hypothetical protein